MNVSLAELPALLQVVLIDVALAGDNAVVVGMAVAGLPYGQRRLALVLGIGGATVLRVLLGIVTLRLLNMVGLVLAGGLLLLGVCWRMYRDLRQPLPAGASAGGQGRTKSLSESMVQIVLADLSMSVDNVLAVAGAAEGHAWVLVTGLVVSVALMGIAASVIAALLDRHRWIAWGGLAVVLYVALKMILEGGGAVLGVAWQSFR